MITIGTGRRFSRDNKTTLFKEREEMKMSATNTTPNIGLPSFIGTDKPAWLTDWNGAMSTIDTEIGTIKTGISGDETRIGNLENSVSSLNTTVSNHTTSITALNTQVATQGGTINTITSLIGNGTPTTTDQTIIGAINELHANQGDLSNLVTTDKSSFVAAINEVAGGGGGSIAASAVSYDNTSSGLTANNVQAAIDEIAQGGGSGQYDFNLTAHTGSVTVTQLGSFIVNTISVRYAMNADYSIGKIYGVMNVVNSNGLAAGWNDVATFTISGFTCPDVDIDMGGDVSFSGAGTFTHATMNRLHIVNNTITFQISTADAQAEATSTHTPVALEPCIYFFTDFGD